MQSLEKKIKILVASKNPAKLNSAEVSFKKYFKNVEVTGKEVQSGVSDTPITEKETLRGVKNRMKVLEKERNFDFKISVEAGTQKIAGTRYLFTWVMIKKGEKESFGRSISYPLPSSVNDELEKTGHLSEIAEKISGVRDERSKDGLIGFLSKGKITRSMLTEGAVMCALLTFLNEDIYK